MVQPTGEVFLCLGRNWREREHGWAWLRRPRFCSSKKEELDNKIETKDNEEEKTVVKDNKKIEEKPIENEKCEYQENFTDDNVEEEECEYQENFSDANDQENSEEECEYQENFSNTNEGNLNKFTLYEQNFDIPVSSGYSV